MPAKGKGRASKKSGGTSRKKTARRGDSAKTSGSTPPEVAVPERAAQTFKRGVLIRGEAAVPDESGNLPPGTTHEIVGEDEQGLPVIERRRYSAF
jgi:hypothetical protein